MQLSHRRFVAFAVLNSHPQVRQTTCFFSRIAGSLRLSNPTPLNPHSRLQYVRYRFSRGLKTIPHQRQKQYLTHVPFLRFLALLPHSSEQYLDFLSCHIPHIVHGFGFTIPLIPLVILPVQCALNGSSYTVPSGSHRHASCPDSLLLWQCDASRCSALYVPHLGNRHTGDCLAGTHANERTSVGCCVACPSVSYWAFS